VILEKAAQYAERLDAAMKAISTGDRPLNATPAQNRFVAALDNDLDTRKGVATLLNLADEILFRAPNGYSINDAQDALWQMASVFGLRLNRERPEERVASGWADYGHR
jgi:cysteinyl-tRNA synthetase